MPVRIINNKGSICVNNSHVLFFFKRNIKTAKKLDNIKNNRLFLITCEEIIFFNCSTSYIYK
ncbi:hypothetical protein GMMP1_790007 [Candidatus Magnetomoraceae bacterium gMMP-1]